MKKYGLFLLLGKFLTLSMGSLWAENIQKIDTVATIVDSKVLSDPYLPQHLGGEIFVKAKDANFLNSLVGRIAGITVQPSSMGTGGGVKIEMRGVRSFQGNNNGEFYQFNLSSCIRQQNSLTAQFVSFSLANLANIFYPPDFYNN